ncbi:MAG: NTP transferase domain-containing protein [Ignavibacteriae bacterium]|nr:NTP transferase domain-containing protein [Ignavibacteriota bacterium]
MIPIIILAGGLATRLYPVTHTIAKSMIKIAGKPFIAYQLELLKSKGLDNVIICAGKHGEQIQEFIKNGEEYGLEVKYSFDGKILLGTGGAIKKALNFIENEFFIMYGDSYLDIDFQAIFKYFQSYNKLGLMTVHKNDNLWDKSNVIFKDGKLLKYNKKEYSPEMNYIDYGLGVLNKKSFDFFQNQNNFDLSELYMKLLEKEELIGYEVFDRFYEIGSFEGIKETEIFLKNKLV